jgi:predicted O-methyltransferase YrrM
MEHFYMNLNGEDWFSYPKLYSEIVKKCSDQTTSHLVEVGSWKGKSACFMAVEIINSHKNIKFDCVDCWLDDTIYNEFIENTKIVSDNINVIKEYSIVASSYYKDNSLDFVFIDAHHTYDTVTNDIKYWYPKVKKDGIIAGHDFWISTHPNYISDVNAAVIDLFKDEFISTNEGCWIHIKNKETIKSII